MDMNPINETAGMDDITILQANNAKKTLAFFSDLTGEENEDALVHLLIGLRHLCDMTLFSLGSFSDANKAAKQVYRTEVQRKAKAAGVI